MEKSNPENDVKKVPNSTIGRLPLYLQYIRTVPANRKYISATKIASDLQLGEVLVRKDLASVSNGGRRKTGYVCNDLKNDIEKFLEIENALNTIIIGKKEIINILLTYENFDNLGIKVIAGFSTDCQRRRNTDKNIYPLSDIISICREQEISGVVLLDEIEQMQQVFEQLFEMGVKAVLNCTSLNLQAPSNVIVRNESISTSIMKIRMQLKNR